MLTHLQKIKNEMLIFPLPSKIEQQQTEVCDYDDDKKRYRLENDYFDLFLKVTFPKYCHSSVVILGTGCSFFSESFQN